MAEQLRISNGSARGADPNGPVLTNLAQLEPDIQGNSSSQKRVACFENLIRVYILPLVYGAALDGPHRTPGSGNRMVSFDGGHTIRITLPGERNTHFNLKRFVPFTLEEKEFIEQIMRKVHDYANNNGSSYHLALSDSIEYAIASCVAPEHAELLFQVMQVYNQWAGETHEGRKIAHTVGLCLNKAKGAGSDFFALHNNNSIKLLGAGRDTILTLDSKGTVLGVENISSKLNNYKKNQDILAPIALADVAMWTHMGNRVAFRLTPGGEILLFRNKRLVFAKRRSCWRVFPHNSLLNDIMSGSESPEEEQLRKAVYMTVLDMALSNRGACLGILLDQKTVRDGLKRVRPEVLFSASAPNSTTRLLADIVGGRKFYDIPRLVRADLCAIDGAVLLNSTGDVLTAGAILKTNGNAAAVGGRTAAALTLARNGVGIKVSSDGYVEFYGNNNQTMYFG